MATALQQQLASIAAKSTNQLDLKTQRVQHSKSLLFEAKDAANQTFDNLYQICAEGFQDLCALDARFLPFTRSIFSEQSKGEDRTQMTAKENEELDRVIESFLGLVGGRLLLRPGLKAVEWLVRRFRVHEYNSDTLILTFLPYHTNAIFPTLLSILPKQLSPAYKFLQPYITSLASPPRHAVLYAAINNPGFFSALNQYTLGVARQGHQSATCLGFWASIVAQAINGQIDGTQSGRSDVRRQREEDLLLRVVPVLQDALRIRNVPELFLGSCMIMTILVTKTQLEDKVLDSLMDAVVKSWSPQTINDGMTCLAVIAEERQATKLPRTTAKALTGVPDLSQRLIELGQRHQTGRLHLGVALYALEAHSQNLSLESLQIARGFLSETGASASRKVAVLSALAHLVTGKEAPISLDVVRDQIATTFSDISESPQMRPLLERSLEETKINLDDLETTLQVPLRLLERVPAGEASEEVDVEMLDEEKPDTEALIQTALDELPQSLPKNASFLNAGGFSPFDNFSRAFYLLVQSRANLDKLLDQSALQRQNASQQPTFFSFLIRLSSSKSPSAATVQALRTIAQTLQSVSNQAVDLQAMLPFALVALSHTNEVVRRAASELMLAVSQAYQAVSDKGKVPQKIHVWAQDTLYGTSSSDINWLASQDAYKFIANAVVPNLEECILDPNHVARAISNCLNASDAAVELKTALRTAVFAFLASHATICPVLTVRKQLLSLLARVGKVGTTGRTQMLVPGLEKWLSAETTETNTLCAIEGLAPADISRPYISCLTYRSAEELECLKSLAKGEIGRDPEIVTEALHRVRHLFPSMKPAAQISVASFLLDLALQSGNGDLDQVRQTESLDALRHVDFSTEVLVSLLDSVPDIAEMPDKPSAAKRRRTSRTEVSKTKQGNTVELQITVQRLTLVLELIEGSKPERHPELLKSLFHILAELQHYKTQLGSDLVYLQQMVIGSLLSIVEALKKTSTARVDRSVLRADLIVDCVRSTSSTQVHNSALLLISSLASWAPDLVLHSVMPIFTFMSTTILRQSDDYSAHIIDQTVSKVVPPLVASLRKRNQDLVTGASELLLSFTAAFEHIPLHRRLRLFTLLVEALGPDESLPAILAMLAEKYPSDRRVPTFSTELMSLSSAVTQLKAARRYLEIVEDMLRPKRTISEVIFGLNEKTSEQIERSAKQLMLSLAKLLQQRPLHIQISKSLSGDVETADQVRSSSAALLEKSLGLAKALEGRDALSSACGTVVASSLGLLPSPDFVRSALPLLDRPDESLQLKVLQSLESRAENAKPSDNATRTAMLDALPSICKIIGEADDVRMKHSAITCVDNIAEKFGKKEPSAVLSAAEVISSDSALGSSDDALRIISLLCLSSAVEILKDDMVPLLPPSIEKSLQYLSDAVIKSANAPLHDAVYALLGAVLEYMPWVLSAQTLERVLRLTYQAAVNPDLGGSCAQTRDQFSALLCRKLEMKTVVSVIEHSFDTAAGLGFLGCHELLSILHQSIKSPTKAVLLRNASGLFSILKRAFDLRRVLSQNNDEADEEDLEAMDDQRDRIMLDTIMKLNDATFRPFFVRLVEWATDELPKKDSAGRMMRLTSFYGFLARFFESLKSIVTGYSSYVLDHMAATLKEVSATTSAETGLVTKVVEALTSSFKHDQDDFWQSPSHFSTISTALLAQLALSNAPSTREEIAVIPAITELATVAGSPDNHKSLNSALLLLLRSDDENTRLAAVKCEQSLTERLGEDWLGLLPEMLPFISELQEDDSEVVERECLVWIRSIEGILGESLEGMLQ